MFSIILKIGCPKSINSILIKWKCLNINYLFYVQNLYLLYWPIPTITNSFMALSLVSMALLSLIYFLLMTVWCSPRPQLQNVVTLKSCLTCTTMHLAKLSIFENHLYFSVQTLQRTPERRLKISSTSLSSLIMSNTLVFHQCWAEVKNSSSTRWRPDFGIRLKIGKPNYFQAAVKRYWLRLSLRLSPRMRWVSSSSLLASVTIYRKQLHSFGGVRTHPPKACTGCRGWNFACQSKMGASVFESWALSIELFQHNNAGD